MESDPTGNVTRLGTALMPFEEADLVLVFGSEGSANAVKSALEEIAAPDLVTLMIGGDHALTGTWHGVEGFIEAWRDFSATFSTLRNEIREIAEVRPGVVYAETRQTGTTATAGVEIDYAAAAVFRFVDGKLEQAEFHLDRDAARRAAGLALGEPGG
jgi:ketosteroid isomerase-like protein